MKNTNSLTSDDVKIIEKKVFPKEDVDLLAAMCSCCTVITKPRRFFRKQEYLYYVPSAESYVDIAKDLFAKHGLEMQIHKSRILGIPGQKVLRTEYDNISEESGSVYLISQIQERRKTIFNSKYAEERKMVLQKAQALMMQKQK